MEIDRREEIRALTRQTQRVIRSTTTVKKSWNDYPAIQKYLTEKFPEVTISDISIYVASPRVMNQSQFFRGAAGCYIHHMRVILVHNTIHMMGGSTKGLFNLLLSTEKIETDVEDILVHEAIHAISAAVDRSGRRYKNDEEEFVYTNCIDFYKKKGMSDADIVNKIYLPFCVSEVMQRDLKEICNPILHSSPKYDDKFLDKHAKFIVPEVLKKARNMGFKMIELYNKWGRGIELAGPPINSAAKRLGSIDFEC